MLVRPAGTFSFFPQTDLKAIGDYNCNQELLGKPRPDCVAIGLPGTIAAECLADFRCRAFVAGDVFADGKFSRGGFLKSVDGPRAANAQTDVYVRLNPL